MVCLLVDINSLTSYFLLLIHNLDAVVYSIDIYIQLRVVVFMDGEKVCHILLLLLSFSCVKWGFQLVIDSVFGCTWVDKQLPFTDFDGRVGRRIIFDLNSYLTLINYIGRIFYLV